MTARLRMGCAERGCGHTDTLAMAPTQRAEPSLTSRALTSIAVREDLAASDIVPMQRTDLPLTPAAGHLLDLMRRVQHRMLQPQ